MKCGSVVSDTCKGAEITMNDYGWQLFCDEAVSNATFLLTITLEMGTDGMSYNMQMGLNSLRCALLNMGGNTWNLLAAAYFAAKQFGMEDIVKDNINLAYEHVCTCGKDVKEISDQLNKAEAAGVSTSSNKKSTFSSCSETASGVQTDSS